MCPSAFFRFWRKRFQLDTVVVLKHVSHVSTVVLKVVQDVAVNEVQVIALKIVSLVVELHLV